MFKVDNNIILMMIGIICLYSYSTKVKESMTDTNLYTKCGPYNQRLLSSRHFRKYFKCPPGYRVKNWSWCDGLHKLSSTRPMVKYNCAKNK
jgi:hypothetical protein